MARLSSHVPLSYRELTPKVELIPKLHIGYHIIGRIVRPHLIQVNGVPHTGITRYEYVRSSEDLSIR